MPHRVCVCVCVCVCARARLCLCLCVRACLNVSVCRTAEDDGRHDAHVTKEGGVLVAIERSTGHLSCVAVSLPLPPNDTHSLPTRRLSLSAGYLAGWLAGGRADDSARSDALARVSVVRSIGRRERLRSIALSLSRCTVQEIAEPYNTSVRQDEANTTRVGLRIRRRLWASVCGPKCVSLIRNVATCGACVVLLFFPWRSKSFYVCSIYIPVSNEDRIHIMSDIISNKFYFLSRLKFHSFIYFLIDILYVL